MNKYKEFKNRKIKTVGELIKKLQEYPLDTKLDISGRDLGGYDVCNRPYCEVYETKEGLSITHMEYEMYESMEKGEITNEEFRKLNNEI